MASTTTNIDLSSKEKTWFDPSPKNLQPSARKLLEEYSKIESDNVIPHLIAVRDKAFKIFPYPCIGQFRFMDLSLEQTPVYQEVIDRLKKGETFLDFACCFGQEIRDLVASGVPSENIYGADLKQEFLELGYELFEDRQSLKSTLLAADLFSPSSELKALEGKMNIIYTGSFFHLFNYEKQVEAGKLIANLLKQEKGSMIVGRQVGSLEAHESSKKVSEGTMYMHNEESLKKQWQEIGDAVGTKFDVAAELKDMVDSGGSLHEGEQRQARRIWFVIRIAS